MTRTLAEMRASGRVRLPQRTVTLCLAQDLVSEAQALEAEKEVILEQHQAEVDEATKAAESSSKKAVERVTVPETPARVVEIDERLTWLLDEMRQDEGDLVVRGEQFGKWRTWADEHPARENNETDKRTGYGLVNITALAERIGDFMLTWNGAEMTPEDREHVIANASPGALTDLCSKIVQMHEADQFRPKALRPTSSATPTSEPA